jgi:hypothetical protein
MDGTTLAGVGVLAVSAATYIYPKAKKYLASKSENHLPHDAVKTLINYFTAKKCKKGLTASVEVGKLLYEECENHVEPPNNLP